MKSILLVGEQNPHNGDPLYALHPLPAHGSGGRLAKILALSPLEYMRLADRVNLCYDAWDWDEARRSVETILAQREVSSGIVLLGRKAEDVFGWVGPRYESRRVENGGRWFHMLALPHPSGLCRDWNDPQNVTKARMAWGDLRLKVGKALCGYCGAWVPVVDGRTETHEDTYPVRLCEGGNRLSIDGAVRVGLRG